MRKIGLWVVALAIIILLALPMGASAEPAHHAGGSGCTQWYTIRCGDTLSKIASYFGTSVSYLASLNGISNPNYIVAGTTICVKAWPPPPPPPPPPSCHPCPPPPPSAGFYYTVRCGDTLGNIGWKYGWGALTLAQVNHIYNPDLIYPGQVLWIPGH